MSEVIIYHNPRCSKSRQTLALLEENGVQARVVHYLEHPPSVALLQELLGKLGLTARELVRKGEAEYKEQDLADESMSEALLLAAMSRCPKLIERPIVVKGERAVLGRPPQNVLELLRA
jgi:arsenate reductase